MEIFRVFTFEAAHFLPHVPDGHKCGRLHGHSYRVTVSLKGDVAAGTGWVMDFAEVKMSFTSVLELLDHRLLNEVEGLENPTSENLARWIWNRLDGTMPMSSVTVRETCTSGAVYRGGDCPAV